MIQSQGDIRCRSRYNPPQQPCLCGGQPTGNTFIQSHGGDWGSSTGAATACRIFPVSALLIGNRLGFAFQALLKRYFLIISCILYWFLKLLRLLSLVLLSISHSTLKQISLEGRDLQDSKFLQVSRRWTLCSRRLQ